MPVIEICRSLKQEDFEFGPNLAIKQLLDPFRLHIEILCQTLKLRDTHTNKYMKEFRVMVAVGRVLA